MTEPIPYERGSSRLDENGREWCGHGGGEARYLQVLCPSWEARTA